MSEAGQNLHTPSTPVYPLPPSADITPAPTMLTRSNAALKQGKNGNGSPPSKRDFVAATQHANKIDQIPSGCC
jgi:hypothetical protein